MTASVQDSRLKRRFQLWDANGDGTIDRTDYETEARRLLQNFGEQEGSPKGRRLFTAYLSMWDKLAEMTGVGPYGAVTEEQFMQAADSEVVRGGDAGFDRSLRPTIEAIVDLCDTDGDRKVSPQEFAKWLQAIGVDKATADEAFRKLDANRDGFLDTDELINAVREYHEGRLDVPLLGR